MDLCLELPTKMIAEERSLQRQSNIECLFFMSVKTDADDNPILVLTNRSPGGKLVHKAGSKATQNSTYTEGIDDTMVTIYGNSTHFLGRTADLHSGRFADLQVSHI